MLGQKNTFRKLISSRKILFGVDIKLGYIAASAFLSLIAALLEGLGIYLLIPLLQSVIKLDLASIKTEYFSHIIFFVWPGLHKLQDTTIFAFLLSVVFFLMVIKCLFQYLAFTLISRQVRSFSNSMRKLIFARYLSFGKTFFDNNNPGRLHNLLLNLTNTIILQMRNMEQLIPYFFLLIMYLTVMAIISWQLTAIVIAIFPILSYLIRRFVEKIKKTSAQYADAYEALSSKVSNIISAMILVKLYSKQSAESKHFEKISNKIEDTEFNIDKMQNAVGPIQEVAVLALVIIVISAMACIIAQGDTKHIAGFLVYFYLLKRSQYVIGVLNNMRASFAVISGPLMVIWETFKDENKFIIKDGKKKFSGLKKAIELRHLRFFHGDKEILKDITGTIEQGKVTAILGPTGSGKTTVINLIMYLYESPPVSIIIDGVDIRDFTEQSLREHIAVVSQEVALFNDTIKNNIIYGLDHEISDKELADVLKKARLQEFIKNLPKGLDSHIGDRGVMISGGEKQKISLARALLKNAEILILDEATSSIDAESECQIREGVAEAIKNRTSIIIAHHLRMVQHADNIIVIEKGQTVEEGPPDKLLEKKGKFYAYWQRDKYF